MRKIIFLVLTLVSFSCTKNTETNVSLVQWNITDVQGTLTGYVNQPVDLTVYWPYLNGSCDVLDKFEETRETNIAFIKALGHSEKGICTDDAGIKTEIYKFFHL